jgi:tripartite-type tricarboxylate transporter receptor subunit TctC
MRVRVGISAMLKGYRSHALDISSSSSNWTNFALDMVIARMQVGSGSSAEGSGARNHRFVPAHLVLRKRCRHNSSTHTELAFRRQTKGFLQMSRSKTLIGTGEFFALCALIVALPALCTSAQAQSYPTHPVKIVVPTGPGGSYDIIGRLLGDQLQKRMGQAFVIENRIGAGTVLGTQAAASAPADGYTLLIGGLSNIIFNAGLYKKLPYDPLKDLVPVAMAYTLSYVLVGSKELPQKTPAEIIAAAKQKPGSISLANAGAGTGQHLMGVAFQKYAGIKFLEVPYRGASAVYPDLLSGRVDLFFDSVAAALPYIKGGQARGIASLTAKRNSQIPDVPTMTESGVANLEVESWLGVFAPAKTPKSVIETLRAGIAQALPDLRERFITSGGDVFEIAPDKLDGFMKAEYDKWTALIHDAGITLD